MALNDLPFEEYFHMVKERNDLKVEVENMPGVIDVFQYFGYEKEILDRNIEFLKECHKQSMSPYKALLFIGVNLGEEKKNNR